jgi:arylsulfatase A-like enzyme
MAIATPLPHAEKELQRCEPLSGQETQPSTSSLDILAVGTWLALVVGFSEGFYWYGKSVLFDHLIFMHPGCVWMSAWMQLGIFAIPVAVLVCMAWKRERLDLLLVTVTALSFIAWLNLLMLVPGLFFWARLVAAAGLATATGRFFVKRRRACLRFVRYSIFPLLVLAAILPPLQLRSQRAREADLLASLPAAQTTDPNILFVVLDTVRADALDLENVDRSVTPNLARLANRGVVFEQAMSNAPWTLPSMASIFTGRLPHACSADWQSALCADHPTLAENLSERGYLTGGFVANTRYCSRETGLARGFAHYDDYRLSLADFALCTALGRKLLLGDLPRWLGFLDWPGRKRAPEINRNFVQWLDRCPQRPFFAFVNYWDAHDPYIASKTHRRRWPRDAAGQKLLRNWWWVDKSSVSQEQLAMLKGAYDDCVRALDEEVGGLLQSLEDRHLLENTIVIVTSDHGEHFAEHGLYLHGNSLYEPLIHVPLLVVYPQKLPGTTTVHRPVALNGLPNTILELLDQQPSFPGTSWLSCLDAGASEDGDEILVAELASPAGFPPCHGRSPVCTHGSMRCLRQGSLKYIRSGSDLEELFDLSADPAEQVNLVNDADYAAEIERFRAYCQATDTSE